MSSAPPPKKLTFRFDLPPSLGAEHLRARATRLEQFFTDTLGRRVEVQVAQSYEQLAKDVLSGRTDAAWAPPFVCARLEAMAARALARGVRKGKSVYRSALVCLNDRDLSLEKLSGTTVAWVDKDSVAGHLLPIALLRSKGIDPQKTFFLQTFVGSYRSALEQLCDGKVDVAAVFAPAANASTDLVTGAEEVMPGCAEKLKVLAFTDESPNDGVVLSPSADGAAVLALEKTLLTLDKTPEGRGLLAEVFSVDRFEVAPRMGYRALYRVAMASLV